MLIHRTPDAHDVLISLMEDVMSEASALGEAVLRAREGVKGIRLDDDEILDRINNRLGWVGYQVVLRQQSSVVP